MCPVTSIRMNYLPDSPSKADSDGFVDFQVFFKKMVATVADIKNVSSYVDVHELFTRFTIKGR